MCDSGPSTNVYILHNTISILSYCLCRRAILSKNKRSLLVVENTIKCRCMQTTYFSLEKRLSFVLWFGISIALRQIG